MILIDLRPTYKKILAKMELIPLQEIYSILKREKIEFQGSGYQIHDFLKFMVIENFAFFPHK